MAEAISDTGPILHLHEIDCLEALGCFEFLWIPSLVARELESFGLSIDSIFGILPVAFSVGPVEDSAWKRLEEIHEGRLQPADAQVLALASAHKFRTPVLTDDLEVRRAVENEDGLAVGSIGILVKNYNQGRFDRSELEGRVEQLLVESSLHMSRPFRRYVRTLLREIQ